MHGALWQRRDRLRELLVSPEYRKILFWRVVLAVLNRLNPHLQYIGIDAQGERTILFSRDVGITPCAVALGGFQKDDLLFAVDLAGISGSDQIFLDVGANIGTQTVYALNSGKFARAICLEPIPANVDLLHLNLQANRLSDRAIVAAAAAGDQTGELEMELSPRNCGDHRVRQHGGATGATVLKLPVWSLDAFLAQQRVDPHNVGMLWIDVQGHEPAVLAGAPGLLQHLRCMVIELWPWGLRRSGKLDGMIAQLSAAFATFHDLKNDRARARPIRELADYVLALPAHERATTDLVLLK